MHIPFSDYGHNEGKNFLLYVAVLACEAIALFCEIAKQPLDLLHLCKQHRSEINRALEAVTDCAGSVDNLTPDS